MNKVTEQKSKTADEKFCNDCGEIINTKAEICPKCGVRQPATFESSTKAVESLLFRPIILNRKSRITTALLALFLGGIGVHKFYLGQVGLGVIYLSSCWTLIPALIGFIEFIIFLSMSDQTFSQKYSQKYSNVPWI